MGCVYCVVCKENGKMYVGKTKQSLKKRQAQHYSYAKRPKSIFHKALVKYGFDKFEWKILYEDQDEAILYQKEKDYIKELNTITPYGYNLTTGGDGNYNVHFSDSWRAKNRQRATDLGKMVYCVENNEIYATIADAAKALDVGVGTVSRACNKKYVLNFRGLHFCYANYGDMEELKEMYKKGKLLKKKRVSDYTRKLMSDMRQGKKRSKESIEKQRKAMLEHPSFKGRKHTKESLELMSKNRRGLLTGKNNGSARAVQNIDTGMIFDTMKDALIYYKLQSKAFSNISSCCRGKLKTAYGFRWKYADLD